jgi:polyvinyl alcohol dehydrogenase (cytochrome)
VAGQKSSQVYGLNPDTGEVLWENRLGKGSAMGGVEWGMATDGKLVYAANADIAGGKPGIHALDPATGQTVWFTPAPKVRCAWREQGVSNGTVCVNSNSQAPSMIPGALIAGTIDGHLRAYDPKSGEIFWDIDAAAAKYNTVNGYTDQPGGAFDAGGPIIANGMLVVLSGYNGMLGGTPNNVILAFSIDGK